MTDTRDPVANVVTETFLSWTPDLIEVTSRVRESASQIADSIIKRYWNELERGAEPFRNGPFFYRRGNDSWCQDDDWIRAARTAIANPTSERWNANRDAIETLLAFGEHDVRPMAMKILDTWLREYGGTDYGGYLGLVAFVYPNHQASRRFVENPDWQLFDLPPTFAATSYQPLIEWLEVLASQFVNSNDLDEFMRTIEILGFGTAKESLNPDNKDRLHAHLLDLVKKTLSREMPQYVEESDFSLNFARAAEIAAAMDWNDVCESIVENPQFPQFMLLGYDPKFSQLSLPNLSQLAELPRSLIRDLYRDSFSAWTCLLPLSWQIPEHPKLKAIVAQALIEQSSYEVRLAKNLSLAIAWKRICAKATDLN